MEDWNQTQCEAPQYLEFVMTPNGASHY